MTFSLRSLSARRYRIEGDLPSVGDPAFSQRLLDRAFQPLSAHEERTFGWVTADNCLDTAFAAGAVARGPCAVFSLRVDKRRVPTRLLRARIDLVMRGRRKDADRDQEGAAALVLGKARARMSRDERQEIRREVTEELLRTTSPSMEVHPVVIYPRERVVLFGSLSRPSNETFRALFSDTFDVTLSTLTPYHRALELLADRGGGEALAGIRRTDFGRGAREQAVARNEMPVSRAPFTDLAGEPLGRGARDDKPAVVPVSRAPFTDLAGEPVGRGARDPIPAVVPEAIAERSQVPADRRTR